MNFIGEDRFSSGPQSDFLLARYLGTALVAAFVVVCVNEDAAALRNQGSGRLRGQGRQVLRADGPAPGQDANGANAERNSPVE